MFIYLLISIFIPTIQHCIQFYIYHVLTLIKYNTYISIYVCIYNMSVCKMQKASKEAQIMYKCTRTLTLM